MESEDLAYLKKKILEEINITKEAAVSLKEISKPVEPDVSIGRLTRMEAIQSKSINEASLKKAEIKIKNLEKALLRIEKDPDFGLCLECENEIPLKRLIAMPETRFCVKCMAGKE